MSIRQKVSLTQHIDSLSPSKRAAAASVGILANIVLVAAGWFYLVCLLGGHLDSLNQLLC